MFIKMSEFTFLLLESPFCRLLELCKQSFKFWGKKLVIDQLSLLTDVLKKLKDLMLMKEKEYEGI